MEWLNYHHLLYFWMVAKEGGVTAASRKLRLAQPTVSGQLRALEEALGEKLFDRVGRSLVLTDVGRVVFQYAEEIFGLGRELQDTLKGRPTGGPLKLTVGVSDGVPKLVAYRLIAPALKLHEKVRVVIREDRSERLLADLSVHELDIVLSDQPIGPNVRVRAFNHLLGECGVTFMASPEVQQSLGKKFPKSLDGVPFLFPAEESAMRRALEQWFEGQGVRPVPAAEIQDSALLKVFGQAGAGVFAVPTAIESEVTRQSGVRALGRTEDVKERFYAISVERRLKHPAVVAISEAARSGLFG